MRLCLASKVSMWSKKPTPVATLARPVPSRSSFRSIRVSAVSRRTCAARAMVALISDDAADLLQQPVDLAVGADRDADAVAVAFVIHVADEDVAALQFLVDRLDGPAGVAAPDKVRLAGRDAEAQALHPLPEPGARRQHPSPRGPQVLLVLQGRRRRRQAEHVAVVGVLDLDQIAH